MVNTEAYDLPHSVEQRGAMASRIARAVLNFQDQLLEADSNTGSLCQVNFTAGIGGYHTVQNFRPLCSLRYSQVVPTSYVAACLDLTEPAFRKPSPRLQRWIIQGIMHSGSSC